MRFARCTCQPAQGMERTAVLEAGDWGGGLVLALLLTPPIILHVTIYLKTPVSSFGKIGGKFFKVFKVLSSVNLLGYPLCSTGPFVQVGVVPLHCL